MRNLRISTSFSIGLAVKCRLVQVTKMGKNRRGIRCLGGKGVQNLTTETQSGSRNID